MKLSLKSTRDSVRQTMVTLARAAGITPEELVTMSAAEYQRRRNAVRYASTRETIRP